MTDYSTWKVGDKVVCVNAKPYDGPWGSREEQPIEGKVYTLKSIHIFQGGPVVWINELDRCASAKDQHGPLVGYGVHRFRRVFPRKTDISVFTAMLNKTGVDA